MRAERLTAIAVASAAAAVLGIARLLAPAPGGLGTHVALGLPPCGFLRWSGLPCPTCGLTTSFAELAHLELARSLRAHPLGWPLFALTVLSVPLGVCGALHPERLTAALARVRPERWALMFALALLTTWIARLIALARS